MSDWQKFLTDRPGSTRPRFSASSRQFMPDAPAELFESQEPPTGVYGDGVITTLTDENEALKSELLDLKTAMSRAYYYIVELEQQAVVPAADMLTEDQRRWRRVFEQHIPAAKRDYEAAQAGDSRDPLEKFLAPRPA